MLVNQNTYAENMQVYWAPGVVSQQTNMKAAAALTSGQPAKRSGGDIAAIANTDTPDGFVLHSVAADEYVVLVANISKVQLKINSDIHADVTFSVDDTVYWSTVNSNYTNASAASDTVEIGKVVAVETDYIIVVLK